MAREASGGLPDPPITLRALGGIRAGSLEPPFARNHPEPVRNDHIFLNGQVNYRDIRAEFCEADQSSTNPQYTFCEAPYGST